MRKKKIELRNDKEDLKKLVRLMNAQNRRHFPPVDSLLGALDVVLDRDELGLLLRLGTDVYTYDQAIAKSEMDLEKFKGMFEVLRQKGFMGTKYTAASEERYTLHPFIVGWLEAQVPYLIGKPEEKEFTRRWMKFMTGTLKLNFFPLRNMINNSVKKARVNNQSIGLVREHKNEKGKSIIDINQRVDAPDSKVYPTKSINDLISEYGSNSIIGQFKTCMCRRLMVNMDDHCRFDIGDEGACMGFGDMIKPFIEMGHARQISREEAYEVIQKSRDKGAVHTVFHEQDDTNRSQIGLCNCCWGLLRDVSCIQHGRAATEIQQFLHGHHCR